MTGHPDVLVIGPTRAGTSWLNWAFSHHPDAWVPYFKELHYFNVQKHKHFNKFHAHHRVQLGRKWSKLRSRGKWPPRDEVVWMAKYFFMPRSDRW